MFLNYKNSFSFYFFVVLLAISILAMVYGSIYFIWTQHNNILFKNQGEAAIATIIQKENGRVQYDIEYKGVYYRNWITVSKKTYRKIVIGEKFDALILPEKLKHDRENGIWPRYVKIVLRPRPILEQDLDMEIERIKRMYPSLDIPKQQ